MITGSMANSVSVLQWGLPILLGALGFSFGRHKWRVDRRDQLKLTFYHERKGIYDAVKEFGDRLIQNGTVTHEDLKQETLNALDKYKKHEVRV
jgi:hypothetical protein